MNATASPAARSTGPTTGPTGVVLINLGTPAAPTPFAVARYLRQFLMDPLVLDVATWRRFLLVHLLIVPFRSRKSSRAYREIWTDRGSPLLFHGLDLAAKVGARLGPDCPVTLGMRYGQPSIGSALEQLRDAGCHRIVALSLYAQATAAATTSSHQETADRAAEIWREPVLSFVPPFFLHPAYLEAKARMARPVIEHESPDRVFFSFHGIPERQIRKNDPSGNCLERPDCCAQFGTSNAHCYRAQCYASARALADRLEIAENRYQVCFQSRLGRTPWIQPHTDRLIEQAPAEGARNAVIVSSFVTDCLETLEELRLRGAESWRQSGGDRLTLVSALNAEDLWADAVVEILSEHAPELEAQNVQ